MVVVIGLVLPMIAFSLSGEAYAVCCFPYDMTHSIEPDHTMIPYGKR